jgi:hypothetical protein
MLLEEKLVVTKQDTASKDTFFLINLIFQSNIGLKISHQKMKNVTRGGGEGGVRKVPIILKFGCIKKHSLNSCYKMARIKMTCIFLV